MWFTVHGEPAPGAGQAGGLSRGCVGSTQTTATLVAPPQFARWETIVPLNVPFLHPAATMFTFPQGFSIGHLNWNEQRRCGDVLLVG